MPWSVVVEHHYETEAAEFCDLKAAELGGEAVTLGSTEVGYGFPDLGSAQRFIAAVTERGLSVDEETEEVEDA